MYSCWRRFWLFLFCLLPLHLWAGGSGLNVVVVVNQNSSNSVQLGNYYCEKRQLPPQNLLRITWPLGNTDWSPADFTNTLVNPLLSMLASQQLTNQIDYVLLSMDIPYRVISSDSVDSTTSALFYGFKTNTPPPPSPSSCSLPSASSNSYAASESVFRLAPPLNAATRSFLTTMITASNLPLAKLTVDQGVLSDGSFPTQTVLLAKSPDNIRNIRYLAFDNAIFNTRLRGNYAMQRTNLYSIYGLGDLLGFQTGVYDFTVGSVWFVPGGFADNLTSFGGQIFYNTGQLSILSLLAVGATGSYGTVDEPCAYLEKFPSPQNYFYQARGFSLAECYYQSVTNPYQGLILGEPLAAPFAQAASGSWLNLPANTLLSSTTNLSLQAAATDSAHPLKQVDLFVDGVWNQILTNLPPSRSNLVNVTINGQAMNYLVPLGATVKSVAAGLTSVLNSSANTNATKVFAQNYGDRIELQSFDRSKTGAQVLLSATTSVGAGVTDTTFVTPSGPNFLDTIAYGLRNFVIDSSATYPPPVGAWLKLTVTKTNGTVVPVAVTNTTLGTTVPQLVTALMNQVNANSQLTSNDGCAAEDFIDYAAVEGDPTDHRAEFNLRALNNGWDAAQLQASVTSSSAFVIQPAGSQRLDGNILDLHPRNNLFVSAGVTNLPLTFAFNTASLPDGFHELTAVVYEGSHIRTQKRIVQSVRIQNTSLSASFIALVGASNSALEGTLQFSIAANTSAISKIELFSTGGSLGSVSNVSSNVFSVTSVNLGLGLHPFYAIVTATAGQQYRTDTKWIRLVGADSPLTVAITAPPTTLTWAATAGRSYDILSTTNLASPFLLRFSLVASNSTAEWIEPSPAATQRFYRVRTSN